MALSDSIEDLCDLLGARYGTPQPSRYDDANCKKKGTGGGKQMCAVQCRTTTTAAKGCGRQARPDATSAKTKKPPSPWERADDAEPKRRESDGNDMECPPPPSLSRVCCEDRWCACIVRRRHHRRRRCEDDPCRGHADAASKSTAAAAAAERCARTCASGCDDYGDDDCRCRCRSSRDGPPKPSAEALPVRRYRAAIDWVRGSAWHVVLAVVAFFAGMYANDYCRCKCDY